MPGTFAREDQPRMPYVYPSDLGGDFIILMEPKYETISGLAQAQQNNASARYPFNYKHLRHIYIRTVEDTPTAGRQHQRRVPCKKYTLQDAPPDAGSIDGLTGWRHGKLIGEVLSL